MANTYVDLATIKGSGGLNLGTGTAYDKRLLSIAENISREVDRYCNRHFYYTIRTLEFDGDATVRLITSDLIAVSTLKEDTNYDGTFETGWGGTDYVLMPRTANPTAADYGGPYTHIEVNRKSNGTQDAFIRGQNMYEVTGTWGYWKVSKDSLLNGTLADGTTTTLTLSGSATGTIETGQTLLVDDELVYVTGTAATSVTVERAVNGSTGTAHTDKDVRVLQFPGPVVEATFIQLARLWRRKDSAFASQVGMPETGQLITWSGGLDGDVKALLAPFRRWAV